MTALTLPTKHRTLWHFVPGPALTAALTGAALWAGSFPAIAGAGFSALTLAILFGMVVGNTVYPKNLAVLRRRGDFSPSSICCARGSFFMVFV